MWKKTVTVKQIQDLDKFAIERIGIPSLVLMENAGRLIAQEIFKEIKRLKAPRVCIICGLGNNAGDGFVTARHLMDRGIKTSVFLIGKGNCLKRDAAVNYQILKRLKYSIKEIGARQSHLLKEIRKADVIVDAIFGVGLNREVLDPFRNVIAIINKEGKKIISVDTPSGLDSTSGKIYGVCVKADVTVTFTFFKKGFFKGQGPRHTGQVIVVDIGIPRKLLMVNGKW